MAFKLIKILLLQVMPQPEAPGKFDVSFTPVDVGDHSVEVKILSGKGIITLMFNFFSKGTFARRSHRRKSILGESI